MNGKSTFLGYVQSETPEGEPSETFAIFVSGTDGTKSDEVTHEDVFGTWSDGNKTNPGMVVATHDEICPIFGDLVPYKAVTVVCDRAISSKVVYRLSCQHGADCITRQQDLDGDRVAFRSEYQCW